MKTSYFLLLSCLIALGISSCDHDSRNNDDVNIKLPLADGTYSGIFKVSYEAGDTTRNEVTLFLEDGRFSGIDQGDFHPAIGAGSFEAGVDSVHFENESVWTANFDWRLILSGDFEYTFNGSQLRFYKMFSGGWGYQEYDLIKELN